MTDPEKETFLILNGWKREHHPFYYYDGYTSTSKTFYRHPQTNELFLSLDSAWDHDQKERGE